MIRFSITLYFSRYSRSPKFSAQTVTRRDAPRRCVWIRAAQMFHKQSRVDRWQGGGPPAGGRSYETEHQAVSSRYLT